MNTRRAELPRRFQSLAGKSCTSVAGTWPSHHCPSHLCYAVCLGSLPYLLAPHTLILRQTIPHLTDEENETQTVAVISPGHVCPPASGLVTPSPRPLPNLQMQLTRANGKGYDWTPTWSGPWRTGGQHRHHFTAAQRKGGVSVSVT